MSYLGVSIVCYAFKLENAIEAAKNSEKKRLQFNTRLLQSPGLWPPLRGADWTFYWISPMSEISTLIPKRIEAAKKTLEIEPSSKGRDLSGARAPQLGL